MRSPFAGEIRSQNRVVGGHEQADLVVGDPQSGRSGQPRSGREASHQ